MKYYVDRNPIGNDIVGLFIHKQYDGQERLDETHPDIVVYYNTKNNIIDIANKVDKLKSATVDQFKFIIEMFEVGKANGLWVNQDFDPALLAKGQEWKQLINDIEGI